ncbi:MAG: hypothetical protein WD716_05700 [Fimbriimonadaceae bacterium]
MPISTRIRGGTLRIPGHRVSIMGAFGDRGQSGVGALIDPPISPSAPPM